ncbi:MAG: hypothetical protein E7388_04500 [Ruminococcaceae bacterium]|nr:hypothetical protein [Oscillospiraceae bacterium]
MKNYIEYFSKMDNVSSGYKLEVQNFFRENVPVFRCSDKQLELIYYFRWWTFYKHLKSTPYGTFITEFLPDVCWAGPYNSINLPAGIHIMESRWLRNPKFAEDNLRFWYSGEPHLRAYTTWLEYAALQFVKLTGKDDVVKELLPDMIVNYACWEDSVGQFAGLRENGLFEAIDDREGTELSISGNGYRVQINSAMYGNCMALAELCPEGADKDMYLAKAMKLRGNILTKLWNEDEEFFQLLRTDGKMAGVRELQGYTPWYFMEEIPEEFEKAWKYITDEKHFKAKYGYTYAEQSHEKFQISYEGHPCKWDGPSWPMANSCTLTAMANLLHSHKDKGTESKYISEKDFCEGLKNYAHCQMIEIDGQLRPWIDEVQNPFTGDWISRTMLRDMGAPDWERGKDYNHSSYCDLIISGLVGLRVDENGYKVEPLCKDSLDWFTLDGVIVKGRSLSISWTNEMEKPSVKEFDVPRFDLFM